MNEFLIENLIFFEDNNFENFEPFHFMHPIWEIRIGAYRIFEKWSLLLNEPNSYFFGRNEHLQSFLKRFNITIEPFKKANTLIINSQVIPSDKNLKTIIDTYKAHLNNESFSKIFVFMQDYMPIGAIIPENEIINPKPDDYKFILKYLTDFLPLVNKVDIQLEKISFLWDTLDIVANQIDEDFNYINKEKSLLVDESKIALINKKNIFIHPSVNISPFCVLDASDGAIIIDENAKIMPHSTIIGPAYIGKNSIIKVGAKIYEKTAIGEFCKVGGEIENTVIQSYSNKQHEGFLGHSFISEWVNLGADTNNSDLKNTYGNIKMRLSHKTIDSKRMFLGLMCGDHTKSAINTQFNTGTIAGICAVLFESGFLKTNIPSFSWGGISQKFYLLDLALETASKVMQRRNKKLIDEEIEIIKNIYKQVTLGK